MHAQPSVRALFSSRSTFASLSASPASPTTARPAAGTRFRDESEEPSGARFFARPAPRADKHALAARQGPRAAAMLFVSTIKGGRSGAGSNPKVSERPTFASRPRPSAPLSPHFRPPSHTPTVRFDVPSGWRKGAESDRSETESAARGPAGEPKGPPPLTLPARLLVDFRPPKGTFSRTFAALSEHFRSTFGALLAPLSRPTGV